MKVNFLDVVIKIKNGRLNTDLYSKRVDNHQYLHYSSCHPKHIKKSIIYSLMGSSKCGSKICQVCLNVSETDILESFQTKRQYKINHHLDCNDKCLIYILTCKICGLQYVDSSTDRFRLRWNNYKDNDRKAQWSEEHMQPELSEHFHSEEHNGFLQDCGITLIDKIDGSDHTRREEYWRVVLKTVAPYGLNRIE